MDEVKRHLARLRHGWVDPRWERNMRRTLRLRAPEMAIALAVGAVFLFVVIQLMVR